MWQRIVTAIAVCLIASCTKTVKEDDAVVNVGFEAYQPLSVATNPNIDQLRDTMRAFTDDSTRLDHGTLSVTLDALSQALHGVPYAEMSEAATEVHRIADVLRTMGPNTLQRTEIVRDALNTTVVALENAALDERYASQRWLVADLAREVDALDPLKPVTKQAVMVKLAICDTANAIAAMPKDELAALPCATLPQASALRDPTNERLVR